MFNKFITLIILILAFSNYGSTAVHNEEITVGKNITVVISDSESVDYKHLQKVSDGEVHKDVPYFDMMAEEELEKLIDYMEENNYIILSGTYTFNQSWKFNNGEFELPSGEKNKVFDFKQSTAGDV